MVADNPRFPPPRYLPGEIKRVRMKMFIKPPVRSVEYLRGQSIVNNPINIDLCTAIKKSKVNWYPDNEGLHSIHFKGCGEEWVFPKEPVGKIERYECEDGWRHRQITVNESNFRDEVFKQLENNTYEL